LYLVNACRRVAPRESIDGRCMSAAPRDPREELTETVLVRENT
jgi:hypothetical protein